MSETANDTAPLTVVLVHGAFADSSSWNGVIERRQANGRAGATVTEAEGSHVIMVSHPAAVADVIETAAAAVDRLPVGAGGQRWSRLDSCATCP